jgi:hypothetical protein
MTTHRLTRRLTGAAVSIFPSLRGAAAIGLTAAVLAAAGCGTDHPKTAVVRGTVTYRGKPVPYGNVNFIPASGPPATGTIGPDGSYTLTTYRKGDGAVLGPHKVVIVAIENMGDRLPEDRTPLPPPIIPDRYTSIATSDLRAEVKAGENTVNFDLKDAKK